MYRVKIEMTRIQNHIITAITQGSRDIMYYIVWKFHFWAAWRLTTIRNFQPKSHCISNNTIH